MRQTVSLALSCILAAALGPVALGAQETPIYQGDLKGAPVPVVVGAWGSGSLQEVGEAKLEGANSLKLVSQGAFQGGRIDFTTPLSIATYAGQPGAYIEIWVRPYYARPEAPAPPAATPASPTAPGGAAEPAPVPSLGARGGLFGRGGFSARRSEETSPGSPAVIPASPGPPLVPSPPTYTPPGRTGTVTMRPGYGAPRTTTRANAAPKAAPAREPEQTGPASPDTAALRATAFRVQLITDRGLAVLREYPVYPGDKKAGAWLRIGFPLKEFDGPVGDQLQSIAIFADRADTVYIGEVKLRLETAPIMANPAAYPAIARVGEPVTFLANASAGLAPLAIEWDFDNADGIEVQAEGPRVVNVYTRRGYYEATVTVRDATGGAVEPRTYALLVQVK